MSAVVGEVSLTDDAINEMFNNLQKRYDVSQKNDTLDNEYIDNEYILKYFGNQLIKIF